jgi:cytochrome c oxidase subunit II
LLTRDITTAAFGVVSINGNCDQSVPENNNKNNNVVGTTESNSSETAMKMGVVSLMIPPGASVQGNPSYDPNPVTIRKGETIQVINKDDTPHTVTSGKGMFLLGRDDPDKGKLFDTSIISPGASAQILTTSINSGEYPFHCEIHPYMIGRLVVNP